VQFGNMLLTNREVCKRSGMRPPGSKIMTTSFVVLGHVLRRATSGPMRATTYDRLANPKQTRAKRRPGGQRMKWAHRRATSGPMRATTYDRFANPKQTRAKRKPGDQRLKWDKECMTAAMNILEEDGTLQAVNKGAGSRAARATALAADRCAWRRWINLCLKKTDSQPPGAVARSARAALTAGGGTESPSERSPKALRAAAAAPEECNDARGRDA